jgi:16S rRNA (adenine1518-N6/adenine1519-N6)-dimethyltransferase
MRSHRGMGVLEITLESTDRRCEFVSTPPIREGTVKRKSFRPRKRFGQNFLYDPAIARKIIDAAALAPGQPVIELGAGRGILTKPLAKLGARLIALEVDRDLHRELNDYFNSDPSSAPARSMVEVLDVDFTKVSLTGLLTARSLDRCTLIGNIPYHLTRDVLFSFLVDEHEMIDAAYLMVQKEVGDRITSPPGSRVYGIPSVVLQALYDVRPLFRVAPGSFFPPPKVASVVVEFKPLERPLVTGDELNPFLKLVKNLFQQRRKTVHSTMRGFYSLLDDELEEIQRTTQVDLQKRPEALGKEEFLNLTRALAEIASVK